MPIGRLLYKYRHGFRTAYYRDRVAIRILETSPIDLQPNARCEVHCLTSASDWLMLVWSLKSFYWKSRRRFSLCIHDDGSLTPPVVETLKAHFPFARIILRCDAETQMAEALSDYPDLTRFRSKYKHLVKSIDFPVYANSDRIMLLDSDVLFFAEPAELLSRIEDLNYRKNSLNRDVATAYNLSPEQIREFVASKPIGRINSGLGLIHRESLRLSLMERLLALSGIDKNFWRIEQTLIAVCCMMHGYVHLPPEYDVYLEKGLPERRPLRHYVGAVRPLLYSEGMHRLCREGILDSPWTGGT